MITQPLSEGSRDFANSSPFQGIVTVNLQTSRLKAVDPMAVFPGDYTRPRFPGRRIPRCSEGTARVVKRLLYLRFSLA